MKKTIFARLDVELECRRIVGKNSIRLIKALGVEEYKKQHDFTTTQLKGTLYIRAYFR